MKQRISVEDLNQLSEEQKEKLREWWFRQKIELYQPMANPHGAEFFLSSFDKGYLVEICECLPLLSIGQMIELLRQKHSYGLVDILCELGNIIELEHEEWHTIDDICDKLWEAVKAVL